VQTNASRIGHFLRKVNLFSFTSVKGTEELQLRKMINSASLIQFGGSFLYDECDESDSIKGTHQQ
jgi:hypothetical protein